MAKWIKGKWIADGAVSSDAIAAGVAVPTATLASVANGAGASLIGLEDAAGNTDATDVEAAIAELYAAATALVAVVNAEAGNAIAIDLQGRAAVAQYEATIYDSNYHLMNSAGDLRLSETGAGAETAGANLSGMLFTTDAAGTAQVTVTDFSGVSTDTFYIAIRPLATSGGVVGSAGISVPITFA